MNAVVQFLKRFFALLVWVAENRRLKAYLYTIFKFFVITYLQVRKTTLNDDNFAFSSCEIAFGSAKCDFVLTFFWCRRCSPVKSSVRSYGKFGSSMFFLQLQDSCGWQFLELYSPVRPTHF
jgi:hypothetical protein